MDRMRSRRQRSNKRICATILLLLILLDEEKMERRFFARPINRQRMKFGEHLKLFQELKNDQLQFYIYTRMSLATFEGLLALVERSLIRRQTVQTIPPEARLAMTLRFLSQGDSLQSIAWAYRCGKSTVRNVVTDCCKALVRCLYETYLPTATRAQWLERAKKFESKWNMPHCVGSIDGKHVYCQAPPNSGSSYFNYKKSFSVVLMAACDADYVFTRVTMGSLGSSNDVGIFGSTKFGQEIVDGTLPFPEPEPLSGRLDGSLPYYFVGDEAFPLKVHLMRPYSGRLLDELKRVFNYRLSRARRTIENDFGILVARWRILQNAIQADPENVDVYVMACVLLHNFLMVSEEKTSYCPSSMVDAEDGEGNVRPGDWRSDVRLRNDSVIFPRGRRSAAAAIDMRDYIRYYLNNDGAVSWQLSYINHSEYRPTAH